MFFFVMVPRVLLQAFFFGSFSFVDVVFWLHATFSGRAHDVKIIKDELLECLELFKPPFGCY